ncbi:hypothetical protein CPAV1605_1492 [seawater metagenome]|uniref:Uncharacterized protein n=1 Tax=seawater metagenome TaxID=1561972 RepID=A0A5E8CKK1_9ZZZZ
MTSENKSRQMNTNVSGEGSLRFGSHKGTHTSDGNTAITGGVAPTAVTAVTRNGDLNWSSGAELYLNADTSTEYGDVTGSFDLVNADETVMRFTPSADSFLSNYGKMEFTVGNINTHDVRNKMYKNMTYETLDNDASTVTPGALFADGVAASDSNGIAIQEFNAGMGIGTRLSFSTEILGSSVYASVSEGLFQKPQDANAISLPANKTNTQGMYAKIDYPLENGTISASYGEIRFDNSAGPHTVTGASVELSDYETANGSVSAKVVQVDAGNTASNANENTTVSVKMDTEIQGKGATFTYSQGETKVSGTERKRDNNAYSLSYVVADGLRLDAQHTNGDIYNDNDINSNDVKVTFNVAF